MKGHVVTLQILFLRGVSWWWEKHFPVLFSGNTAQQARDMWLYNLLSSYSFLIVNCAMAIINNKIIDQLMFCSVQEPYFLILINLQSNTRQRKERLRFSHRVSAYMHLSKCEIFHSYNKSQNFFTFFTFLDQLSWIKSLKMSVYLVKWPLRARFAWQV